LGSISLKGTKEIQRTLWGKEGKGVGMDMPQKMSPLNTQQIKLKSKYIDKRIELRTVNP
jgi:hypothetical protein